MSCGYWWSVPATPVAPMGEAILRARLGAAGVAASVASAGTLGWSQRPATPHAVAVTDEMGLDIGDHVSRRLHNDDLDVDLVVAMTRIHAGTVRCPRSAS